jgi:transposase
MRKKVPLEVKMEALKLLQSGESANAVSKQLSISNGELQTWSLIYAKEGERGLAVYPKNICIGAIKDKIICTYRQKRVPLHILSAKYSVPYSSVCCCISTYKRKGNAGIEGAVIKFEDLMRAGDHVKEELTEAELKQKLKEALNENEYLKAENALLKKVKALVEAEERRNKRSRKPSSH